MSSNRSEESRKMTKDEISLLLYLETRAVDYGGKVASEKMNVSDVQIARRWAERKFIRFSRLKFEFLEKGRSGFQNVCHVVELSNSAWEAAHLERRRRAEKSQDIAVKESLKHFENLNVLE